MGKDYFKNQQLKTQIPSVTYDEEYAKYKNMNELQKKLYVGEMKQQAIDSQNIFSKLSAGQNLTYEEREKLKETGFSGLYSNTNELVKFTSPNYAVTQKYTSQLETLANKEMSGQKLTQEEQDALETSKLWLELQKNTARSFSQLSDGIQANKERNKIIEAGQLYGKAVSPADTFEEKIAQGVDRANLYVGTGITNFVGGTINTVRAIEDLLGFSQKENIKNSTTPYELASAAVSDYFEKNNQQANLFVQQVVTNLAQNFIPMALSVATGGISGTASRLASMASFAPSVFGNAYKEGLQFGVTDNAKLLAYSALNTLSEVGLELLFGAKYMPAGGVLSGKAIENLSKLTSSAFLKFILKSAGNFTGEFIEEGTQSLLNPIMQKYILGADVQTVADDPIEGLSQAAYEGLIGGISAILMGSIPTFSQSVTESSLTKYGAELKASLNLAETDVKNLAQYFVETTETETSKLADNLNKSAKKVTDGDTSDMAVGEMMYNAQEYSQDVQKNGIYNTIGKSVKREQNGVQSVIDIFEDLQNNGALFDDTIIDDFTEIKAFKESVSYEKIGKFVYDMNTKLPNAMILSELSNIAQQSEVQTLQQEETQIEEPSGVQTDVISLTEDNRQRKHLNKATQEYVKKIANAFGVNVIFENVENKTGVAADSYYDNQGNIHMDFSVTDPVNILVKHELTHFGERGDTYKSFVNMVKNSNLFTEWLNSKIQDNVSNKERAYRNRILENYKNAGVENISYSDTQDEMIANFAADMLFTDNGSGMDTLIQMAKEADRPAIIRWALNFIRKAKNLFKGKFKTSELNRLEKKYAEMLKDAQAAAGQKNTAEKGGKKFSISSAYDYSKTFAEQIDDWKNGLIPERDSLIVSGTPEIYQNIGFTALPMTINQKHIDYALNGTKDIDHKLGETLLKQLPDRLKNPIAVFKSETQPDRAVALLDFTHNGKQIVAPVEIDGYSRQNNIMIDSNAITSVFGKSNAITKLLYDAVSDETNGKTALYYWNKKVALSLLQKAGLQLPGVLPQDGYIHSISDSGSNVNKRFTKQTETQQFKRWFGKSKAVDENGNPLIVYHGTNSDFNIFKSTDGVYWFSQSQDYAEAMAEERGGSRIIAAYLSISNPFYASLAPEQFSNPAFEASIIKKAKLQGYDGVIIENATDDNLAYDKFYAVFKPSQIKSATENIGTFDASNPDIRFSIPENIKKDRKIENLKKDVENLKELLKLQKHKTHGKVLSKKSIENTARKIMREYGAKGDVSEFTSLLSDVYNHIVKGEEVSWDSIKDISQEAVSWLKNNQEAKAYIPEEAKQVLNYLKSEKIKLNDIQKSEIIYRYGSISNFRKQFGYYIKISENGVYLDNLWASFVSDNPGYFDTDIVSAEQPLYLADLVDTLRNTKQYEDMYSLDGYENEILSKIYDYYWDIATETTVADKYSQQLNELKAKHREEMDAYKEKTKIERKNYKQKMEENLKKSRQEIRNKLKEKQQIRKLKEQIKKSVNKLQTKLLKPTKNKNVPLSLQKAVASALSIIDTSNTNKIITNLENKILKAADQTVKNALQEQLNKQLNKHLDIDKIKAAYDSIKNSDDPDLQLAYAPEVTNYIEAIAEEIKDTPFKDLSLKQLEDVKDMFDLINAKITQENQFADVSYKMTLSQASSDVQNEISETGEKTELVSKVGDVKSKFLWNNRTPIYAMRAIGSDILVDFYKKLRNGEDVSMVDIEEATQFNKQKKKAYGYYSWDFKKSYTFTDANGKKFNLNLATIMSLYAYSKREQALKHLFVGGFQFSNSITVKKKNKLGVPVEYQLNDTTSYRLDTDILNDIVSTLTANQKSYVEEMQKYLSETMGDKGNEVTKKLYGIKLFKENYYFPIKTAKQQLFELNQKVNGSSIFERSFTKEVSPTAKNPIILGEFNSVWASHVKQMSDYHGLAIPLNDFQKLYNYFTDADKSVKSSIQAAYGDAATQYIQQLIQDINGGIRQDYTTGILRKLTSLFKKGAVFASASVAIQQRSALIRSWALISPKYFISKKIIPAHFIKVWNTEMKKYAPVCIIKEMGRFDTNVGTRTEDYINGRDYDYAKDKFKAFFGDQNYRDDLLGVLPQMADMSAWFQIWEAVKKETSDTTKLKSGTEEFYKHCGERFTDIVTRTQVYDSVFSRSAFMRDNDSLMQSVTSFLSEPTLSLNIMEDAVIQYKRGKVKKSYVARAIGATVLSMIDGAIMKSLITAGRDDDEDKTYIEKYIGDVVGNTLDSIIPFSNLPFFRDIVSIWKGYDVERSDMSLFADLKQAFDGWSNENKSVSENLIDETDKTGIIYSILDELNINTSYEDKYQDLINYSEKGKTDNFDDVMDYLEEQGKDYSDIKSGIKAVFKKDDDVKNEADEYISEISSNKTYQSFTSEDKEKLQSEILDTIAEQKALDVIETEAERFDKLYQYYRTNKIQYEKFKKEMLDEGLTESAISSNMEIAKIAYMKSIGIDVSEYILFKIATSKQYADTDNSGGVSKSEKIKAINKMDLSSKDKSTLISNLN